MWTSAKALPESIAAAALLAAAPLAGAQLQSADGPTRAQAALATASDARIVVDSDLGLRGPLTPLIVAAGDADAWTESIERIEDAIAAEEAGSGLPPDDLAGKYLELGRLYSARGQYPLASAQFSRALEIERIRNGFSTLDQVPVFWELLHLDEQTGNFFEVRAVEERMIEIAESTEDKAGAVPVLEAIAGRRVESFQRFRDLGTPFNILINEKVHSEYSIDPFFNERERALDDLDRSRANYLSAANILRSDGTGGRPEIDALERKIVRTYYLEATIRGEMTPGVAHDLGEQAYLRRLEDWKGETSSQTEFALTLVELADWHLLFERYRPAQAAYAEAYEMLANEPDTGELLQRIFSPAVPKLLPPFETNPLAVDVSEPGTGSVELAIEINQYGRADVREILADRHNRPRGLKHDVSMFFARARFRPRFLNGELAKDAAMTVRFPYEALAETESEED